MQSKSQAKYRRSSDSTKSQPVRESVTVTSRSVASISVLALLLGATVAVASLGPLNDIAENAESVVLGESGGDFVGASIVSLPDFNGDGLLDYALGVPGYNGGTGLVAVFFGDGGPLQGSLDLVEADLFLLPETSGEGAGTSLAAGDFDRDGITDLAIGAPYANSSAGKVYVAFGREDWDVSDGPEEVALITERVFTGLEAGDQAGFSVAAPDLDGDNASDLVIGAPYAELSPSSANAGYVYIRWGGSGSSAGWTNGSVDDFPAYWVGRGEFNLGYSLATVERANNDSKDDLLMGAPDGGQDGLGRAYLILGDVQGNFFANMFISQTTLFTAEFQAEAAGQFNGAAVASAGDVNGDGLDDLLVGAPFATVGSEQAAGQSYLIYGRNSWSNYGGDGDLLDGQINIRDAAGASFTGLGAFHQAGTRLAGIGDVTNDGFDDFLIAAPYSDRGGLDDQGEVYLVLGSDDGYASEISLNNIDYVSGSLVGTKADSLFGYGLSGLGDIDGDGDIEVMIGAPEMVSGGESTGAAYVVDLFSILDADGDDFTLADGDCDDTSDSIYPGAVEVAYNGIDEDCDEFDLTDVDGDGHDSTAVDGGDDCNDNAASIYPGATETPYNNIDENCDGYDLKDVDQDGFDGGDAGSDCNDTDGDVYPNAEEIPYDGIDQDCSGADLDDQDDDGFAGGDSGADCDDLNPDINPDVADVPYNGIDEDCSGADLQDVDGDGVVGVQVDGGTDCDDNNANIFPGAAEACNGLDDDCDLGTDEDFDGDGDGQVEQSEVCNLGTDCDDTDPNTYLDAPEICDQKDNDCDSTADEGFDVDGDLHYDAVACPDFGDDCDDNDAGSNPDQVDVCDGKDNDCNGLVDDPFDLDEDGFADQERCELGTDCDDGDDGVNPGATDIAYDGVDQDCSGSDLTDVDEDGFDGGEGGADCDDSDSEINPDADEIAYDDIDQNCTGSDLKDVDEDGFDGGLNGDDCNDDDATYYPGADEIPYDGLDQDCSGADLTDVDNDGIDGGDSGFDCNDNDPNIYPNAEELCQNGVDDDCNGEVDDNCSGVDADGDGFTHDVDCNDDDAQIYPGAVELCDSEFDLNCDGTVGENCYEVGGGLGCNASSGGEGNGEGALILGSLLGAMALRRRRQKLVAGVAAVGAVAMLPASSVSRADDVIPTNINQMVRPLDALGYSASESATSLQKRQFAVGLFYSYLHQPVQLVNSTSGDYLPLIDNQNVVDVNAAYGITDWLQVGVGLPMVSSRSSEIGTEIAGYGSGFTPASARAQLKISPLTLDSGFSLGVIPTFNMPLSDGSQMSFDGLLALEQRLGRLRLAINGGYRALLEPDSVAASFGEHNLGTGSVLLQGGAAFSALPGTLDIVADVWSRTNLNSDELLRTQSSEASLAAMIRPTATFYVTAGIGSALNSGYGAARLRGFAGVGYASASGLADADTDGDGVPDVWDKCRKDAEDLDQWQDSDGCPDLDNDGDGVADAQDACADEPEDSDGWEDEDGCPDPDNDSDTVLDDVDLCREEPEDVDGWQDEDGCPDLDNDGDGVLDPVDKCPSEAEDMDGILDDDGCPDVDNDKDGIADEDDACLEKPEDLDGFEDEDGCPDFDNDGDGLLDQDEFCPNKPEDLNGFRDDDGCPESGPQVVLVRDEIRILEELRFKNGTGPLNSKSRRHLDEAVKLLSKAPADKFVIVEAHTDNSGDREPNRAKTQSQADVVKKYLVTKGIPATRIVAVGYGEDRPMGTNRTERGRERNRRVVLVLADEAPTGK